MYKQASRSPVPESSCFSSCFISQLEVSQSFQGSHAGDGGSSGPDRLSGLFGSLGEALDGLWGPQWRFRLQGLGRAYMKVHRI